MPSTINGVVSKIIVKEGETVGLDAILALLEEGAAPIEKNEVIGKMKITYKDEVVGNYDLFASESVQKQNIISRILSSINFLIWGDV